MDDRTIEALASGEPDPHMSYIAKPVQPTKYRIEGLQIGYGRAGYQVTRHGLNVMPGRLEFASIADAMRAIECLEYVGGEPALFWDVWNTWKAEGLTDDTNRA